VLPDAAGCAYGAIGDALLISGRGCSYRTVLLVGFPRQFGLSWRVFGPGKVPLNPSEESGPVVCESPRRGPFVERSRTKNKVAN
jgi:hypothetical protein